MSRREVFVVTGMSGAGKSQALKSLEDMGCEAIDNLPLPLLETVATASGHIPNRLAVGVDVRSRDFSPDSLLEVMRRWRGSETVQAKLLFLDADDEGLQRRFTETRRKHPLAIDRTVMDGIHIERTLLAPVKAEADVVVNTSHFSIHDLKRYLRDHFGSDQQELLLFVTSFSYREGLPRDADLVIDARFLRNPHYDKQLRPLTGQDAMVASYVEQDDGFAPFFDGLTGLLKPLLPRYQQEGKSYLTIAIGCTGGKHRSVFVAEKLAGFLRALGYKVGLTHRDLKRQPR